MIHRRFNLASVARSNVTGVSYANANKARPRAGAIAHPFVNRDHFGVIVGVTGAKTSGLSRNFGE
jgi:hypothetical protein